MGRREERKGDEGLPGGVGGIGWMVGWEEGKAYTILTRQIKMP